MIADVPSLKLIAPQPPPHKQSLAFMLLSALKPAAAATGPAELWSAGARYTYHSWEPIFTAIEGATHPNIDDASVIRTLYGKDADWDWRGLFAEASTAAAARDVFVTMRRQAIYMFMQPLAVQTLDAKSYPNTYRNFDVARLFNATEAAKDPQVVGGRVQATAQIMFRILYGNTLYQNGSFFETRTLFAAFTLGYIHRIQLLREPFKEGKRFYFNQGALAWTLLTFAYYIALAWRTEGEKAGLLGYSYKLSAVEEGHWYRFWGLIGSAMGIADELIPRTHADAEKLYRLFLDAGLADDQRIVRDNAKILEVYEEKRDPTAQEFKNLLKWVPNYFGNQWAHPLAWGSYGLSTTLAALKWLKRKAVG